MLVCFSCGEFMQPVCAQCIIREALQAIFRQAEELQRLREELGRPSRASSGDARSRHIHGSELLV
jgi:hypothetical protein